MIQQLKEMLSLNKYGKGQNNDEIIELFEKLRISKQYQKCPKCNKLVKLINK